MRPVERKLPVRASRAVVATNHPVASAAGMAALAAGGTVADAAVAAIFTCAVVEPQMVGPLGGGYVVHRDSFGVTTVIDNYAEGPGAAHGSLYTLTETGAVENDANATGHLAVGIPGCLKGWFALHRRHGVLPIKQVMAPAIVAAEEGFTVSAHLARAFEAAAPLLNRFDESARVFLPGGRPPREGDLFKNPDLGESLRTIADEGPDVLYQGKIGQAAVAEVERGGGILTVEDLRKYEIREPEPIRGTYRGVQLIGTPMSSGGGLLNQLGLNILENFDLESLGFGTVQYWHLVIETLKLMFADRNRYLGDSRFVEIPQHMLLDKSYARSRASLIDRSHATSFDAGDIPGPNGHTTHLTVMASDGSTVTMTQTINLGFGSRVTVPGTGMLLNNNMALFDPRPSRPNSVGPYKRMLTATAATIVEENGRPLFALGTPGGIEIFPAVFQALLNLIDHKMTMQDAIDAPRLWANGSTVLIEEDAHSEVVSGLEALGHRITLVRQVAGNMNGIERDRASGELVGASCWRGDGAPIGISGGYAE